MFVFSNRQCLIAQISVSLPCWQLPRMLEEGITTKSGPSGFGSVKSPAAEQRGHFGPLRARMHDTTHVLSATPPNEP